ncbi:unnamed protein product [Heterobilharzia americana]|nr:unnamed protein product [Heterobilharzia americana]CAH8663175.1 unnamed protein product [Heterobilharzia americana]
MINNNDNNVVMSVLRQGISLYGTYDICLSHIQHYVDTDNANTNVGNNTNISGNDKIIEKLITTYADE